MTATIEERVGRIESLVGITRTDRRCFVGDSTRDAIGIVQREVAAAHGITVETMLEQSRRREVVWPRQIAMAIAYKLDLASSKVIGLLFGDREHGTVLYACRTVLAASQTEKESRVMLEKLTNEIKQKIVHETA